MRRFTVLAGLLTAGAITAAVAASQQPPAGGGPQGAAAKVVEVEKLKDNLFVLRGGGGNTAVFVQASGVTVVDTKLPGWGQPILDKIKELTDKPVQTVINTHTHGDHVSGNVEFAPSVDIITHENTKANMEKMMTPTGFDRPATPQPSIFAENKGRGMPKRTFKDRLTLGKGPDQIDLYYFGRAHTNGDAMVVFPSLRVMHMGDVFPGKQIPIMDANNGGSGVEYPNTLKKSSERVKNIDTIITGHSTLMKPPDLREYTDFIREFVDEVRAGQKAGKAADQIAEGWKMPSKYAGYAAPDPKRLRAVVETILKESSESNNGNRKP